MESPHLLKIDRPFWKSKKVLHKITFHRAPGDMKLVQKKKVAESSWRIPRTHSYLKSELAMKSAEQLNLKNRVDATDADGRMRAWDYYFSGELPSLIHILTSSKKYQTPSLLARKLGIPESEVREHLEKLARIESAHRRPASGPHSFLKPFYIRPRDVRSAENADC